MHLRPTRLARRPRRLGTTALSAAVIVGSSSSALAQVSFEGLGDLPGSLVHGTARSVSADGQVLVGVGISTDSYGGSHSDFEGARWDAQGITALGDLPGGDYASHANGVSYDGGWIVGSSWGTPPEGGGSRYRAVAWNPAGILLDLGSTPATQRKTTHARAVSEGGTVIVGHQLGATDDTTQVVAVRWVGGIAETLGGLEPDSESRARDVSRDGSIIVGTDDSSVGSQAWIWTASTGMVGLGIGTSALAVSPNGQYVVGQIPGGNAGRWSTADGWVDLGNFQAYDVSNDGQVVVGSISYPGGENAILWTPAGGDRLLDGVVQNEWGADLRGWLMREAWSINPEGTTIVGSARNPQGGREAYRLTLPRETWSELGHALAGTKGDPRLRAVGSFVPGSRVILSLDSARNSAWTFLFLGFERVDLPLGGGTLVPAADFIFTGLRTGQSGTLTLATTWPGGVPSGLELYLQHWLLDDVAAKGLAASNAVGGVVR